MACAQAEGTKPDPVLAALVAPLKAGFEDGDKPEIRIPDSYSGKSLILRYQTRTYQIYPRGKAGRLGRELVEREGPGDDGILLRVHVQAKGAVNQAAVPQTIREPYWLTELDVYPVEGSNKQLYVALSYRGTVDRELLARIKSVFSKSGGGKSGPGDGAGTGAARPEPDGGSQAEEAAGQG